MHRWDVSVREGIEIQKRLAPMVKCAGRPAGMGRVAGVDIAVEKGGSRGCCGIVVFSHPSLEVVEEGFARGEIAFPYVPGLLSFREGPLFLEAFRRLREQPDLLIFDGQGIAHPRRFGIASHMGLWLGIPSVGCAKSRLYGTYDEPGLERGSFSDLRGSDGGVIGAALRTRSGAKPVFVSPGHLVGVRESVEIILACAGRYRVPVPTRTAHVRVGEYKRGLEQGRLETFLRKVSTGIPWTMEARTFIVFPVVPPHPAFAPFPP